MKEGNFYVAPSFSAAPCFDAEKQGLLLRLPGILALVIVLDKHSIAHIRHCLQEVENYIDKTGSA